MAQIVRVETRKLVRNQLGFITDRTLEATKEIDHDNSSDRKWLGTHCFWAMRHDREVKTFPLVGYGNKPLES